MRPLTNIKELVRAALQPGDSLAALECYYQSPDDDSNEYPPYGQIVRCSFEELPERPFDAGFGGEEGERVICFSPLFVYAKHEYDGAESIMAHPRHPESIGRNLYPCGYGDL